MLKRVAGVARAVAEWIDRYVAVLMVAGLLAIMGLGGVVLHLADRLSATTRASTHQRVITVEQRCDLTAKITAVLLKDDPTRVPAFQKSYRACEHQLLIVKRIARRAP